jgi:hypothetical protein
LCDPRSLSLRLSLLRTVFFYQSTLSSSPTRPPICRLQQTTSSWTCTSISNNQLLPILKTTNHHSFLSSANMSRLALQFNHPVDSVPLLIFTVTIVGGLKHPSTSLQQFLSTSCHKTTSMFAKFYLSRSLVQSLTMCRSCTSLPIFTITIAIGLICPVTSLQRF